MGVAKKVGSTIANYYDNKIENAEAQNRFVNDNSVNQGVIRSGVRHLNNAINTAVALTPLPVSPRGMLNKIPVGQAKYSHENLKRLNKENYQAGVDVSIDDRLAALGQSKKGRDTVDGTIMKLDEVYGNAVDAASSSVPSASSTVSKSSKSKSTESKSTDSGKTSAKSSRGSEISVSEPDTDSSEIDM